MTEVFFCLEVKNLRDFEVWRQTVTDCVRFRPDRAAIAKELTDHFQDHVRDLERLGYDRALAEERTMKAMGDPVEVGQAMDRAHKPWLGWLWMASRWLALVCLALGFWTAFWGDGWTSISQDVRTLAKTETSLGALRPGLSERPAGFFISEEEWETFQLIGTASAPESVERSGCTIGVPSGTLWKFELKTGETAYYISAAVTVENARFWEGWAYGLDLDPMVLTDSAGQDYWTYSAKWDAGISKLEETDPGYLPIYSWSVQRTGLTRRTYSVGAIVWPGEPVDWVELRYPLGEGFAFHLDFQEVVS